MTHGLIDMLLSGHHSLVVGGTTVRTFDGRGGSDLYRLYTEEPMTLHGAVVADKVVGKGAAALMAVMGVAEVYAHVISQPAYDLLCSSGAVVTYGTLVPNIINRTGTGLCPLETRCLPCLTAEECIPRIDGFIRQMRGMQDNANNTL